MASSAFNLTAELNLRGPSNLKTVVADIRRQLGTVSANVNLKIDPNTTRNVAQLNGALRSLNSTFGQTQTAATNASRAIANFGSAINSINIKNLPQQINSSAAAVTKLSAASANSGKAIQVATTEMQEFGKQAYLAIRRFAAFAGPTSLIFGLTNAIKSGIEAFIEYDRQFVKLQQVTGESANGLQNLAKTITALSTGLGVTSSDITEVASTLAQAGLSARDTERALKALALSELAPSFDDMNQTVEGSIALMRQFGISASDLEKALGSVNAVAAKFAVEASDIITAIQRTGGVFATASKGVSEGTDALNEFIAVFTSVRATTRESAETIATGLRTIFTRIQRGSTIEALKEFGVNLTDAEGKFVGAYKAVELLSQGLSKLDPRDLKFSKIVEELGGFRQIGKVIPLIQQFATAQDALKVAQKGQGSLAADAAKAQESLANKITKVKEEFFALFREIGNSQGFQTLIRGALDLSSALIKIADSVKGVLPVLGVLAAFRGASAISQFAVGFASGAKPVRKSDGGNVPRFARGGLVPGQGDSDTVPAMLQPGEFVIRKKAVEAIGAQNLHAMNKYAAGGTVTRATSGLRRKQKNIGSKQSTQEPYIVDIRELDTQASHVTQRIDFSALQKQNYSSRPVQRGGRSKKFSVEDVLNPDKDFHGRIPFLLSLPRNVNQNTRTTGKGVDAESLKAWIISNPDKLFGGRRAITTKNLLGGISTRDFAMRFANAIRGNGPPPGAVRDDDLARAFESVKSLLMNDFIKQQESKRDLFLRTGKRGARHESVEASLLETIVSKSNGGIIQKFVEGGGVRAMGRSALLKAARAAKIKHDPGLMYSILGKKPGSLSSSEATIKESFLSDLEKKGVVAATKAQKQSQIASSRDVAVVGITGDRISEEVTIPGATNKKTGLSARAVPATLQTGALPPGLARRIQARIRSRIEKLVSEIGSQVATAAGTKGVSDRKSIRAITAKDLDDISGSIFEKALGVASGNYDPLSKAVDFPSGLSPQVASLMGVPSGVMTDVTNKASAENARRKLKQFGRGRVEARARFGRSPFNTGGLVRYKLGGQVYNLQKGTGLSNGEFDQLVKYANTNDFTEQEFSVYLKKHLANKASKKNLVMDPMQLRQVLLSGTRPQASSSKQIDLAKQLMGDPDAKYNPKYDNARRFAVGGSVSRNVGYIDGDVLADPKNAGIVRDAMKSLGISDVSEYKRYLSNLAAKRRKSGDLGRLTSVYGIAGSGKSTFLEGGRRSQESDNARLRKTNRFPILTEADIMRSDRVIDSTAVAGPNQAEALSGADRVIALSSRTKESQEIIKANRKSRDLTGKGLFGRKPGSTKSASLDSGEGEAFIAASQVSGVDPKRVLTLKIGENNTRTRTSQPSVRTPDKTALFYGNFGPTTAGHLKALDQAKKLGIPPQDFVALVGGDTPIDFRSQDQHDRRTAILPQTGPDNRPSRLGMARATFGARGANVAAMPKGSGPGSIPYALKVGDDSYIVPKGGGRDIALVGDKEESSLTKYTSRGYGVHKMGRIGGISGTAAREAIFAGDMAAMKKLLTPEGIQYIQQHMDTLQRRPSLLDAILTKFQKNAGVGRGLSGQLQKVHDELSTLPARKSKSTPPEVVSRMEELRKLRDNLSSKLGRRPSRVLSRLEAMKGYAVGGSVEDTVPALLTPGEFVINKKAAQSIGLPKLNALNRADKIQGYNKGGFVQHFAGGGQANDPNVNLFASKLIRNTDISSIKLFTSTVDSLSKQLVPTSSMLNLATKSFGAMGVETAKVQQAGAKGKVSIGQLIQAMERDLVKAMASGKYSIDQLAQAEKTLQATRDIQATSAAALGQRKGATIGSIPGYVGGALNNTVGRIPGAGLAKNIGGKISGLGSALSGNAGFYGSIALGMLSGQGENLFGKETGKRSSGGIVGAIGANNAMTGAGFEAGTSTLASGLATAGSLAMIPGVGPFAAGIVAATTVVKAWTSAVEAGKQAAEQFAAEQRQKGIDDAGDKLTKAFDNFQRNPTGAKEQAAVIASSLEQSRLIANDSSENIDTAQRQFADSNRTWTQWFNGQNPTLGADEMGRISAASAKKAEPAADAARRVLEARIDSGSQISDLSKMPDFQKLSEIIASANPEFAAARDRIAKMSDAMVAAEGKTRDMLIAEQLHTQTVKLMNDPYMKAKEATMLAAKAMDEANKAGRDLAISFERMANSFNQAMGRVTFDLEQLDKRVAGTINAFGGGASVNTVSSRDANVLRNPKAYSEAEVEASQERASSFFGKDKEAVKSMLKVDSKDFAFSINQSVQTALRDNADKPLEDVVDIARKNLSGQLKDAPASVQDEVMKKFNAMVISLEKDPNKGQANKAKVDELMKQIEGELGRSASDAAKKVQDMATAMLEFRTGALNEFVKATNMATEAQLKAQKAISRSNDTRVSGADRLKEVLGQPGPTAFDIQTRQDNKIKQLTGGITDPKQIRESIVANIQQRDVLEKRKDEIANDPAKQAEFGKLTQDIANLNVKIINGQEALDQLADSSAVASAALDKIREMQQNMEGQGRFLDKLASSTPEEADKLSKSFQRLMNNINGVRNTPQNSREAQNAYTQTLRETGNPMAAARAGQGVLAQQRAETLSLFEELRPLFKAQGRTDQDLGNMQSRLREGVYSESGLLNNPVLGAIARQQIAFTRDPRSNATIDANARLYENAINNQANAQFEQGSLAIEEAGFIMREATGRFNDAVNRLQTQFENIRNNERPEDPDPRRRAEREDAIGKATGGVVYASRGTMVNFEPKGSDTVPAMLTPGEFVVNARATAQHLPLLKAINDGSGISSRAMRKGGIVYLASGGKLKKDETLKQDQAFFNRMVQDTNQQYMTGGGREQAIAEVAKAYDNAVSSRREAMLYSSNATSAEEAAMEYASSGIDPKEWSNMSPDQKKTTAAPYISQAQSVLDTKKSWRYGSDPNNPGVGALPDAEIQKRIQGYKDKADSDMVNAEELSSAYNTREKAGASFMTPAQMMESDKLLVRQRLEEDRQIANGEKVLSPTDLEVRKAAGGNSDGIATSQQIEAYINKRNTEAKLAIAEAEKEMKVRGLSSTKELVDQRFDFALKTGMGRSWTGSNGNTYIVDPRGELRDSKGEAGRVNIADRGAKIDRGYTSSDYNREAIRFGSRNNLYDARNYSETRTVRPIDPNTASVPGATGIVTTRSSMTIPMGPLSGVQTVSDAKAYAEEAIMMRENMVGSKPSSTASTTIPQPATSSTVRPLFSTEPLSKKDKASKMALANIDPKERSADQQKRYLELKYRDDLAQGKVSNSTSLDTYLANEQRRQYVRDDKRFDALSKKNSENLTQEESDFILGYEQRQKARQLSIITSIKSQETAFGATVASTKEAAKYNDDLLSRTKITAEAYKTSKQYETDQAGLVAIEQQRQQAQFNNFIADNIEQGISDPAKLGEYWAKQQGGTAEEQKRLSLNYEKQASEFIEANTDSKSGKFSKAFAEQRDKEKQKADKEGLSVTDMINKEFAQKIDTAQKEINQRVFGKLGQVNQGATTQNIDSIKAQAKAYSETADKLSVINNVDSTKQIAEYREKAAALRQEADKLGSRDAESAQMALNTAQSGISRSYQFLQAEANKTTTATAMKDKSLDQFAGSKAAAEAARARAEESKRAAAERAQLAQQKAAQDAADAQKKQAEQAAAAKQAEQDKLWVNSSNWGISALGYLGGLGQATGEMAYGAANVVAGAATVAASPVIGYLAGNSAEETARGERLAAQTRAIQEKHASMGILGPQGSDQQAALAQAQKSDYRGESSTAAAAAVGANAMMQGAYTAVEAAQAVAGRGPIMTGEKTWLHKGDDERVQQAGPYGGATRFFQNTGYIASQLAPAVAGFTNPSAGAGILEKSARAFSALDNLATSPGSLVRFAGKGLGSIDNVITGGRVSSVLSPISDALSSATNFVRGKAAEGIRAFGETEMGKGIIGATNAVKDTLFLRGPARADIDVAYGNVGSISDYFDAARRSIAGGKLSPEVAMKYHRKEILQKAMQMRETDIARANMYAQLTGGDPTKVSEVLRSQKGIRGLGTKENPFTVPPRPGQVLSEASAKAQLDEMRKPGGVNYSTPAGTVGDPIMASGRVDDIMPSAAKPKPTTKPKPSPGNSSGSSMGSYFGRMAERSPILGGLRGFGQILSNADAIIPYLGRKAGERVGKTLRGFGFGQARPRPSMANKTSSAADNIVDPLQANAARAKAMEAAEVQQKAATNATNNRSTPKSSEASDATNKAQIDSQQKAAARAKEKQLQEAQAKQAQADALKQKQISDADKRSAAIRARMAQDVANDKANKPAWRRIAQSEIDAMTPEQTAKYNAAMAARKSGQVTSMSAKANDSAMTRTRESLMSQLSSKEASIYDIMGTRPGQAISSDDIQKLRREGSKWFHPDIPSNRGLDPSLQVNLNKIIELASDKAGLEFYDKAIKKGYTHDDLMDAWKGGGKFSTTTLKRRRPDLNPTPSKPSSPSTPKANKTPDQPATPKTPDKPPTPKPSAPEMSATQKLMGQLAEAKEINGKNPYTRIINSMKSYEKYRTTDVNKAKQSAANVWESLQKIYAENIHNIPSDTKSQLDDIVSKIIGEYGYREVSDIGTLARTSSASEQLDAFGFSASMSDRGLGEMEMRDLYMVRPALFAKDHTLVRKAQFARREELSGAAYGRYMEMTAKRAKEDEAFQAGMDRMNQARAAKASAQQEMDQLSRLDAQIATLRSQEKKGYFGTSIGGVSKKDEIDKLVAQKSKIQRAIETREMIARGKKNLDIERQGAGASFYEGEEWKRFVEGGIPNEYRTYGTASPLYTEEAKAFGRLRSAQMESRGIKPNSGGYENSGNYSGFEGAMFDPKTGQPIISKEFDAKLQSIRRGSRGATGYITDPAGGIRIIGTDSTNRPGGILYNIPADAVTPDLLEKIQKLNIQRFNKGGVVYANNGALISGPSQGGDTVPAMLTPGEFVVNRNAAQNHMPLLHAINKGYYNRGGMVQYLNAGGIVAPKYYAAGSVNPVDASRSMSANRTSGVNNSTNSSNSSMPSWIADLDTKFNELSSAFNESLQGMYSNLNNVANQLNTVAQDLPREMSITSSVNKTVSVNGVSGEWNKYEGDILKMAGERSQQDRQADQMALSKWSEGAIPVIG